MRKFVIGDTHGCYDEFCSLMDSIDPDLTKDKLIMLGDYIDRGGKSYELITHIKDLREKYGEEHVVLLRGNHEQMAIDFYACKSTSYLYNGCKPTFLSFARNGDSLENYLSFFESLPLYHEDDHFIYVHAGVKHGISLKEQRDHDLLWIREDFYERSSSLGKTVIFGHTPTIYIAGRYYPVKLKNKIALDTACVYGGKLSALEILNDKVLNIHQVSSRLAS